MERTILHSDCNSFYASVECLHNPAIRNKPVAVGGDVEQRHGIILAKNQIAKRYHVSTGEALWQARLKCPDLVIYVASRPHIPSPERRVTYIDVPGMDSRLRRDEGT